MNRPWRLLLLVAVLSPTGASADEACAGFLTNGLFQTSDAVATQDDKDSLLYFLLTTDEGEINKSLESGGAAKVPNALNSIPGVGQWFSSSEGSIKFNRGEFQKWKRSMLETTDIERLRSAYSRTVVKRGDPALVEGYLKCLDAHSYGLRMTIQNYSPATKQVAVALRYNSPPWDCRLPKVSGVVGLPPNVTLLGGKLPRKGDKISGEVGFMLDRSSYLEPFMVSVSTEPHGMVSVQIPRHQPLTPRALRATAKAVTGDEVQAIVTSNGFNHPWEFPANGRGEAPGNLPLRNAGTFVPSLRALTVNGAPVVIDDATHLMWLATASSQAMFWDDGLKYIEELKAKAVGGKVDWRLPTMDELLSLLQMSPNRAGVFISPLFSLPPGGVWSADGGAWAPDEAHWKVMFGYGYVAHDPDERNQYILAVRRAE